MRAHLVIKPRNSSDAGRHIIYGGMRDTGTHRLGAARWPWFGHYPAVTVRLLSGSLWRRQWRLPCRGACPSQRAGDGRHGGSRQGTDVPMEDARDDIERWSYRSDDGAMRAATIHSPAHRCRDSRAVSVGSQWPWSSPAKPQFHVFARTRSCAHGRSQPQDAAEIPRDRGKRSEI